MQEIVAYSLRELVNSFLKASVSQREQLWDQFCDFPLAARIKSDRQQIRLSTAKANGALNAWNSCKDPAKWKTLIESLIASLDMYVTFQMYERIYDVAINKMQQISTSLLQIFDNNNNKNSNNVLEASSNQAEEILKLLTCEKMKRNMPKLISASFAASVLSMADSFSNVSVKHQQTFPPGIALFLVSIFMETPTEGNDAKTYVMKSPIYVQLLENHALAKKSSASASAVELLTSFTLACEINESFIHNFNIVSIVGSIIHHFQQQQQQQQQAANNNDESPSTEQHQFDFLAALHVLSYFPEESIESAVSHPWRIKIHEHLRSTFSVLVVPLSSSGGKGDRFAYFGAMLLAKLVNIGFDSPSTTVEVRESSKSVLFENMKRLNKPHELKGGIATVKLFWRQLKIEHFDAVSDSCRFFENFPTISASYDQRVILEATAESWHSIARPKPRYDHHQESKVLPQAFSLSVLETFERRLTAATPNSPTERLLLALWMTIASELFRDCKSLEFFCTQNETSSSTDAFFTTLHRVILLHFKKSAPTREAVCIDLLGYYYFRVATLKKSSILSSEIEKSVIDFCSSLPFSLTYHKIIQLYIDDSASMSSRFENMSFFLCGYLVRFFTDNPTALEPFLSLPHDDAAWKKFCHNHALAACPDEVIKTDLPSAVDLFTFLLLSSAKLRDKCIPSAQLLILSTPDDVRAYVRNQQLARHNDKSNVTTRIIRLDNSEIDFSVVPVTQFIKPGRLLSFTFNSSFHFVSFGGNEFKNAASTDTVKIPLICFICTSMAPCVLNYENGLIFYHPHLMYRILAVKQIPTRNIFFVMLDAELGDIAASCLTTPPAVPGPAVSTCFTLHDATTSLA